MTGLRLGLALLLGTLAATRAPAEDVDPFQKRINTAIARGRDNLLGQIPGMTAKLPGGYPMGRLALPLAAALKGGASTKDPAVVAAFDRLAKLQPAKTYGVACYLFALDALARKQAKEGVQRRSRTFVGRKPHQAKGDVRKRMAQMVEWLVGARAEGMGYWNYGYCSAPGAQRHDFSNAQFAVLGLQIGIEHGIAVPRKVFEEIAKILISTQTMIEAPEKINISYGLRLEDLLQNRRTTAKAQSTSFTVKPGGWQYTAVKGGSKASMTAAGASSLLVARNGLGRTNLALRQSLDKALVRSYAWINKNFNAFIQAGGGGHGLYTMYSLEKVGDLGEIEKFGEHNWYVEGATILLDKQQGDGGWAGGYVNTSFAVFFLTRATRLKPYSAPKILTNSPAGGGSADRDLVFIGRLNGFISAKEVLKILGDSRNANMVSVGEEVVRNYNQNFVGELAPVLLSLWTGSSDKVSRFARASLQQITGLSSSNRNDYADWYASFEKVDALSTGPGVNATALSSLLKNTTSPTLKGKILDLAHRNKLYQMAGDLVGELAISKSHDYRLKVNGLLNLWSGRSITPPAARDADGWKKVVDAWRTWAVTESSSLVAGRRLDSLLSSLEKASAATAPGIIKQIVSLGDSAIPHLRRAVEKSEYSFHLIEALEQLTGEEIGLR
ncbi:MAG: hypothetical protein VYB34_16845 [Planctomycetota bacterium]|nr:hypothetical protein [Planctomycetota bacterium]MEE3055402.1 hypothetical protein [Planctomycetota bacterium]